ncbi:hypothetical protein EVA_21514 [gut metagenome]|uniref:Uncharacterized protein n=1 Tax=gut metagenome TaxID=749906 RepID=J9FSL7_9ZZZZ
MNTSAKLFEVHFLNSKRPRQLFEALSNIVDVLIGSVNPALLAIHHVRF